ncbi:MAG: hypothetical protein HXS54_16460 [Theionarchaea archaeon]|nr:hypothetical protein [Theionarchaea archaeon]
MALLPCSQRQNCPNNNVLLVDTNAIGNLIKVQLPEQIDHTHWLVEHFNTFLIGYRSLLERIFSCSIDKKIYVTKKIFDEIDMKRDSVPFRCDREFKTLRTICQNSADHEKMNNLHQSIFSIEETDKTDLKKLRENFQNASRKVSDQDLSLAVLALKKMLEMKQASVIITDDEDFISFLKRLREQKQINLTFGEANCSLLAYRRLIDYIAEIYRCCNMEKIEYEPIYFRLCMIYDRRTDVTDPQKKKQKRRNFELSAKMFVKTTIMKYPHLGRSEFQPQGKP